ncbi:ROK family transcriptional regulator [Nakamurella leprariae]|uniref:ROK family protein n=1 Tax=Nakamurella leprariae TaxID=2803911 RepID=A0A939C1S1_9ACTN|nr:ROK family transcriptional regulator [Nakamurella leprariae]MBM9467427.1 ROK family protein [Nakamurella leprariae]
MQLSPQAGDLLRVIRSGAPRTRAELGDLTGWARVTVNARIDELLDARLVRPMGAANGARGRPAGRFGFDASQGTLLIADVGASAARVARCDLNGTVLAQDTVPLFIGDGPDTVLGLVIDRLESLRAPGDAPAWGLGMSLPGPIEISTGRVVSPPIMTGWNGIAVPELLRPRYDLPILILNDSDAMAWGEHVRSVPRADDLLLVKVGTGVGAGIVANGRIVYGAQGAAGDLGHTVGHPVHPREAPPLCRCGKTGCIEAYAGGWAIARDLAADGAAVTGLNDVLRLLQAGDPRAIQRIREAGRVLGSGLALAVSLLNPSEIVVAGQLAVAGEHLLSGIREHVAANSLPLATRDLRIRTSDSPNEVGVTGVAHALADWILAPEHLAATLARL